MAIPEEKNGMTVEELLKQPRELRNQINVIEHTLDLLHQKQRDVARDLRYMSYTNGNSIKDTVCDLTVRILSLQEDLDKLVFKYNNVIEELHRLILKIENTLYREVLIQRYIYFKSWKDIAKELNYTEHYIRIEIQSKAINILKNHHKPPKTTLNDHSEV